MANTQENGRLAFPRRPLGGADGTVHLLWYEGPIGKALRDQFFPDIKRTWAWRYARIRNGKVVYRHSPGGWGRISTGYGGRDWGSALPGDPGQPAFRHLLPGHNGPTRGKRGAIQPRDGDPAGRQPGESVVLPLQHPLRGFFTATHRGGSPPRRRWICWATATAQNKISYARVPSGDEP